MKLFLLFLCISFIMGANLQQSTRQRRRLMGSIAVVMVATYFLFEQFI